MKKIKASDLQIVKEEPKPIVKKTKWQPKFLGMKKEDIHRIAYNNSYIYGYDDKENTIYYENSSGCWWKAEYDDKGNRIYYEDSDGYWWKTEYNNEIRFIDGKYYLINKLAEKK